MNAINPESELGKAVEALRVRREVGYMVTYEINGEDFYQQLDTKRGTAEYRAALEAEYRRVSETKEYYFPVTRVYIAGRHAADMPANYVIVGQENVTFSYDVTEVKKQIAALWENAVLAGADALVFQNTPGVVSVAIAKMFCGLDDSYANPFTPLRVGVIVSKQPDVRAANVRTETGLYIDSPAQKEGFESAIRAANPRARVEYDGNYAAVVVDPITAFEFVKIEWF